MAKSFSFGIVGTGWIAAAMAEAILKSDKIVVQAVASRNEKRAEEFAKKWQIPKFYGDYDALLDDDSIEGVYLTQPTGQREAYSLKAAAKGKHILSEKPFLSLAELDNYLAAATKNQVFFMDATHWINHIRSSTLRDNVNNRNKIGKLIQINSNFCSPNSDRGNIRFDPSLEPDGFLGDIGWYPCTAVSYFIDQDVEPVEVLGRLSRDANDKDIILGGNAIVTYANGVRCCIEFSCEHIMRQRIELIGTKGSAEINDFVVPYYDSFEFPSPGTSRQRDPENYPVHYRYTLKPHEDREEIITGKGNPVVAQHIACLENFAKFSRLPAPERQKLLETKIRWIKRVVTLLRAIRKSDETNTFIKL
eukprot:TRINITY_DN16122_c0_g1_i1.p1 TRINITY_DN16122_c0_g1~~TRINITY_DN16122_c0_g1_i1.p1  ORF type:complete len:374 (+),score=67.01 TRINITY_DN16122_c0_g1_i1:39-1124(+)